MKGTAIEPYPVDYYSYIIFLFQIRSMELGCNLTICHNFVSEQFNSKILWLV